MKNIEVSPYKNQDLNPINVHRSKGASFDSQIGLDYQIRDLISNSEIQDFFLRSLVG